MKGEVDTDGTAKLENPGFPSMMATSVKVKEHYLS